MNWLTAWVNRQRYKRIVGVAPQPKDVKDYKYTPVIKNALEAVDMRHNSPYVKDQKTTNSCSAFAMTSLFEHEIMEKINIKRKFSPLFTWYNARVLEGKEKYNEGVYLRNMFKAVLNKGLVYEKTMPFKRNYLRKPPSYAWSIGLMFKKLIINHKCKYSKVKKSDINKCLSEKNPILFGMRVNNSFYYNKNGFIQSIEPPTGGGHAMALFGYFKIDTKTYYIVKNSWGARGDRGYLYIEETYLKKHGFDYWTISLED